MHEGRTLLLRSGQTSEQSWLPSQGAGGHATVEARIAGGVSHAGVLADAAALDALASFILLPQERKEYTMPARE